jgi:hypothetical protein
MCCVLFLLLETPYRNTVCWALFFFPRFWSLISCVLLALRTIDYAVSTIQHNLLCALPFRRPNRSCYVLCALLSKKGISIFMFACSAISARTHRVTSKNNEYAKMFRVPPCKFIRQTDHGFSVPRLSGNSPWRTAMSICANVKPKQSQALLCVAR